MSPFEGDLGFISFFRLFFYRYSHGLLGMGHSNILRSWRKIGVENKRCTS